MKILYIHGLNSSPNEFRMGLLQSRGHQVGALHLDYLEQPDSYSILKNYAVAEGAEYIIGSSLGGFLGFWLAEELGLPCLLFNPAMWVTREEANIPLAISRTCPDRRVVLGALDEEVDPQANWTFFKSPENQAPFQRVLLCQWLPHQIDDETYRDIINWTGL